MYLCLYSTGQYDDYQENNIFVTPNVETAEKWVSKVNRVFPIIRERYQKINEEMDKKGRLAYYYTHFYNDMQHEANAFNSAVYREIEFRK